MISRNIDVGQTVAASFQAPTLFTIAQDLTKMEVDTNVAEGDVGKVREKMEATFTVDAFPTRTFHGVVRQVRDNAQTLQNVVTYNAVIDVDNSGPRPAPDDDGQLHLRLRDEGRHSARAQRGAALQARRRPPSPR